MGITTHVLDNARGRPAAGIRVVLEIQEGDWKKVGEGVTDADGRVGNLVSEVSAATYRLRFDTRAYIPDGFFPEVVITFEVRDRAQHYHVPLLLSPFGYSTYRGS
jgi:5-hydroxyisourate hydrolase